MRTIAKLFSSLYICLFCSISYHTPIHAQTEEEAANSIPERNEVSALEFPVNIHASSDQVISYDNIYGIEITLPFAGDIEMSAAEDDRIVIKLEKQGMGVNEEIAQQYLDAVKLDISRAEDIVQLTPQLPENLESEATLTRINCLIQTPPDISVKIKTVNGNIRVSGIRGAMNLTTNVGHVHFNETMGQYRVDVVQGRIYGRIFLTNGNNIFETRSGSIDLVVLDTIAAPMDFTAIDGGIRLRLPEDFPAEVEIENEERDRRTIHIELPTEIDHSLTGDVLYASINGGGPLIRLHASDQIAILAAVVPPSEPAEADTNLPSDELSFEEEEDTITLPTVEVSRTVVSPVIDGSLFEKAWSDAVPLRHFYQTDGIHLPTEPTQVFLMWDEQYLYIGVRAYDSQMKQVRVSQTRKDAEIWDDDAIEILVDPNPQTFRYYHLIVNPIAVVFDQIVQTDYPLDARFAPIVGEAKRPDLTSPNQSTDWLWEAKAQVKTQITPTFWSVEIALPRAALESASSDHWRFNVLRKVHRRDEYSYWSPTYDVDTPWWPHWREWMGILRMVPSESSQYTQAHELEEKLGIAAIEVHGNSEISTPEILQLIPFKTGEIVTVSELSWLKDELDNHGWFREIHLETADALSDEDERFHEPPFNSESPVFEVVICIHVTEMPTRDVQVVSLHNNRYLLADTLRTLFGLETGRTSIEELETKCQLITSLYQNRGYRLASTHYQFAGDKLLIDINEGSLDEIRFVGNRRVQTSELIDALDFKQGEIFNRIRFQSLIDGLGSRLRTNEPYFKTVKQWQLKREKEKNVLEIEIEEQSYVDWNLIPIIDFNRVHGIVLGGTGEVLTKDYGGGLLLGGLSYGLSSDTWHYQLGVEKRWFERRAVSVGGGIHKLTDTNDDSTLSPSEEFLAALVLGDAFMDYYSRQGYQAWVRGRLTPSAIISLRFTDEKHEILFTSTDWSLFNRNTPKKSNLRINEGHFRSILVSYDFDSRDYKSHLKRHFQVYPVPNSRTTRGWRGNFAVEYAGKSLQTDFDFTLYRFKLARYNRLSNDHFLDFRLVGGFSDAPLPRQRLFYLGSIGTLRGYGFKEFVGDNMLLFNMEYRFRLAQGNSLAAAAIAFLDTGYTWYNGERPILNRFYTSIGVGLSLDWTIFPDAVQMDTVRVEIARALRNGRNINFILRLARMF